MRLLLVAVLALSAASTEGLVDVSRAWAAPTQGPGSMVPYASTWISQINEMYRVRYGIYGSRNVATFEFRDPSTGQLQYISAASVQSVGDRVPFSIRSSDGSLLNEFTELNQHHTLPPKWYPGVIGPPPKEDPKTTILHTVTGKHSEELIDGKLEEMKVPIEAVTKIFSNLQPCSEGINRCAKRIIPLYEAEVTWNWPYQDGSREAEKSTGHLEKATRNLEKISAEYASQFAKEQRDRGATVDVLQENLGGVDFSTLELRYLADTYDGGLGPGVQYAYRVDTAPGQQASFGGRKSAQLAADSFFTWLVLDPESFTVNLNPAEPNRIIDERLGRTDAGRVLLEADLAMKKTVAKLIHPNTERGREFWDSLVGASNCLSMRQWIVPRTAVVHEHGNELYILETPLEVKMESEHLASSGGAGGDTCPEQASVETRINEVEYRVRILPELEKAVNTAPEYADLRRVYASRVAAEWYRQRSATKPTAYSGIVDSGDASAWTSRVEWDPKEVYTRFVNSYWGGEFNVKRTTREGRRSLTRTYVFGGVDFSTVPKTLLGRDEFLRARPAAGKTLQGALSRPTAEEGTNKVWLGGHVTERPMSQRIPPPISPFAKPLHLLLMSVPILSWLCVGVYLFHRRRAPSPSICTSRSGRVS